MVFETNLAQNGMPQFLIDGFNSGRHYRPQPSAMGKRLCTSKIRRSYPRATMPFWPGRAVRPIGNRWRTTCHDETSDGHPHCFDKRTPVMTAKRMLIVSAVVTALLVGIYE
jgi:hypothetical protein